MMMKKLIVMALVMMIFSGCKAGVQTENSVEKTAGGLVREPREVSEFNSISLIGAFKVVCTLGSKVSVMVESTKGELENLQTEVKNGVLTVSRKKIAGVRVAYGKDNERTTVYVTVPVLKKVSLVGSGDIVVKGKVKSDDALNVSLSGSGDIEMDDVDVKFAKFSLAGSGDVRIANAKGLQVDLQLAGSGDMDVKSVDADGVKVSLAGSGDVKVGQVKAANVSVSATGSGDMEIDRVDCAVLTVSQTSSCDMTINNVRAVNTNVSKIGSGDLRIAGTTNTYSKTSQGSGDIYDKNLKYGEIKQKNGRVMTVSTSAPTSPNGIEARP